MAPTRTIVALFTFLYLIVGAIGETCYYPDGSTDSGHFACSSGGTSVCCAEGFECLSNGLCNDYRYENYERVLRGGCTDKNWGDGCPQTCTSVWPQGDEAVYICSNGKFCCGRTEECCDDSDAEFFDFGNPQVIATAGKTQAQPTSAANEEEGEPQATSRVEHQQTKSQEQEQQQETKASSQLTQVEEQDEPDETKSQQQEDAPSTSKAKASSAGESSEPEVTNAPAKASSQDDAGENTTKTGAGQGSSSDATNTAGHTASPSDSFKAASPAGGSNSGPTATNTIINNITTPSSSNTVAIAVGVGVGAGVLLFLLVLAGCWYIRRKRRGPSLRSRNIFEVGESATPAVEVADNGTGVVGGEKRRTSRNPFGRGSGMVYEMDGGTRGVELAIGDEVKEMHGESVKDRGDGMDKKWPGMFT